MGAFLSIIRTGIAETDQDQEKRGIVLSNCIGLILVLALVLLNITWALFFAKLPLLSYSIIGFVLFLSPIVLNRFRFTQVSRIVACLAPVLFIWYVFITRMLTMDIIWPSVYSGLRIYLLAVCFVPYLLFHKNSLHLLILGSLPTFLSIVFLNEILTLLNMGPGTLGFTTPDYELQPVRTIIAYGIISAGCYVFHAIINRNDQLHQKLLAELKKQAAEIKSQNEKLIQSEANLYNLNQNLEELVEKKIENIRKQNELLSKYAHANAHFVRGPVARILGLIQIKRIDPGLTYPWFFEKVEEEINQLDKVLKRISAEFNQVPIEHEQKNEG